MTAGIAGAPVPRMWRHIPKIVVLSAIGLLVLTFYFTRTGAPDGGSAPNVVYINQGVGTAGR